MSVPVERTVAELDWAAREIANGLREMLYATTNIVGRTADTSMRQGAQRLREGLLVLFTEMAAK